MAPTALALFVAPILLACVSSQRSVSSRATSRASSTVLANDVPAEPAPAEMPTNVSIETTDDTPLPAKEIHARVVAAFPQFHRCFLRASRDDEIATGFVCLAFIIAADGRVVSATTAGSTYRDAEALRCVEAVALSLSFTPPGDEVKVRYACPSAGDPVELFQ